MGFSFTDPTAAIAWTASFEESTPPWTPEPRYCRYSDFNLPNKQRVGGFQLVVAGTDPAAFQCGKFATKLHSLVESECHLGPDWTKMRDFISAQVQSFLGADTSILSVLTANDIRSACDWRKTPQRSVSEQGTSVTKLGKGRRAKLRTFSFAHEGIHFDSAVLDGIRWHGADEMTWDVKLHRKFHGLPSFEQRRAICRSTDAPDRLRGGAIASLEEHGLVVGSAISAPLISLWRLGRTGRIACLAFQLHCESGGVLELRASTREFEYHLWSSPMNLWALREALSNGGKV